MKEQPAKGTKGFILYSPITKDYFFRVYREDKSFVDYKICTEEIEVEILSDDLSFKETPKGLKLDWSEWVLKPQPGQKVVRVSKNEAGERVETHGHYDENLKFIEDY